MGIWNELDAKFRENIFVQTKIDKDIIAFFHLNGRDPDFEFLSDLSKKASDLTKQIIDEYSGLDAIMKPDAARNNLIKEIIDELKADVGKKKKRAGWLASQLNNVLNGHDKRKTRLDSEYGVMPLGETYEKAQEAAEQEQEKTKEISPSFERKTPLAAQRKVTPKRFIGGSKTERTERPKNFDTQVSTGYVASPLFVSPEKPVELDVAGSRISRKLQAISGSAQPFVAEKQEVSNPPASPKAGLRLPPKNMQPNTKTAGYSSLPKAPVPVSTTQDNAPRPSIPTDDTPYEVFPTQAALEKGKKRETVFFPQEQLSLLSKEENKHKEENTGKGYDPIRLPPRAPALSFSAKTDGKSVDVAVQSGLLASGMPISNYGHGTLRAKLERTKGDEYVTSPIGDLEASGVDVSTNVPQSPKVERKVAIDRVPSEMVGTRYIPLPDEHEILTETPTVYGDLPEGNKETLGYTPPVKIAQSGNVSDKSSSSGESIQKATSTETKKVSQPSLEQQAILKFEETPAFISTLSNPLWEIRRIQAMAVQKACDAANSGKRLLDSDLENKGAELQIYFEKACKGIKKSKLPAEKLAAEREVNSFITGLLQTTQGIEKSPEQPQTILGSKFRSNNPESAPSTPNHSRTSRFSRRKKEDIAISAPMQPGAISPDTIRNNREKRKEK